MATAFATATYVPAHAQTQATLASTARAPASHFSKTTSSIISNESNPAVINATLAAGLRTHAANKIVLPEPASYKATPTRDHLVEQYYCIPGPDLNAPDYNSLRGISGMNYRFPRLNSHSAEPIKETTWSLGTNRRMRSDLSSIEGNKPAPDMTCIRPPVQGNPTGATQRFRESRLFSNGQYNGAHVLEGVSDFRPQTPEAVSYSPVISRTRTRHDEAVVLDNSPYPVRLQAAAGTMFTHYSKREYKPSR